MSGPGDDTSEKVVEKDPRPLDLGGEKSTENTVTISPVSSDKETPVVEAPKPVELAPSAQNQTAGVSEVWIWAVVGLLASVGFISYHLFK